MFKTTKLLNQPLVLTVVVSLFEFFYQIFNKLHKLHWKTITAKPHL